MQDERRIPSWLDVPSGTVPAGYSRLVVDHRLQVGPRPRISFVSAKQSRIRHESFEGRTRTVFPSTQLPGESARDHLEFAFKYDGIDLEVLAALFEEPTRGAIGAEITRWVRLRPTSQYARRAWFLYEWLTGRELELEGATTGNYVQLLDPAAYYTGAPVRSRRHRVIDNLLGNASFCPIVRRTEALAGFEERKLDEETTRLVSGYDAELLRRAVNYLYTRETRSSFRLEGETPDLKREARFVDVLSRVEERQLDEAGLTTLQNAIVLPGAEDEGFRKEPVYVGEQLDLTRQLIHFVAPRHEDLHGLMEGWLRCIERMASSPVSPIVQAAVASFGFVFLHPFRDGNGRIHRWLIHQVLTRSGFTPKGIVLPISAVILQKRAEYDAALESVSRALMPFIDFEEIEDGRIVIHNQTASLYRFIDYTRIAEDLARWTEATVRTELRAELEFVSRYRDARREIESIADLPDRLLNVFIQVVAKNNGRLSKAKRPLFERLSDVQIERMEQAVRDAFGIPVS